MKQGVGELRTLNVILPPVPIGTTVVRFLVVAETSPTNTGLTTIVLAAWRL
jgi:hypothetical protein